MDELVAQFAIEARELVQQASQDLLVLEADPQKRESLESAFRAIHTLKGSVAIFDFGPMQGILHRAEDLLSQARAGRIVVDAALIDPLLAVVGWVEESIEGIVRTGRLAKAQEEQAAQLLIYLNAELTEQDAPLSGGGTIPDWARDLIQRSPVQDAMGTLVAIRYEPHPECFFNGDDPLAAVLKLPDLRHLDVSLREAPSRDSYDPFRCNLVIEAISGGLPSEVEAVFRLIPDQVRIVVVPSADDPSAAAPSGESRQVTMIRVDPARLDRLVEVAGELITAKNGLVSLAIDARDQGDGELARRIAASHQELSRLVGSLYTAVTRARMIPLDHTFRRFPRLVRETSVRLGKSVDLIIAGESVEADREIVENLFEPLLHLIRNGLDHGIEPEEERARLAKPSRGRILLRARQQGDLIEIEVGDDGRGLDADRVRAAVIARNLLQEDHAAAASDQEILQFIFAPGFSLAASVSDLSGRGVGLDAVQSSIRNLGGMVGLHSRVGSGTTFRLKLPVSFSMTQLMVVEVAGERYGIPIADVIETHKLPVHAVQPVRAGKAFILRDRTLPLLRLGDLLQIPSTEEPADELKVLVVRTAETDIGIVVDGIAERTETLTRPLAGLLQGVKGITGTTLLGDGRVLLVLNMKELVQ